MAEFEGEAFQRTIGPDLIPPGTDRAIITRRLQRFGGGRSQGSIGVFDAGSSSTERFTRDGERFLRIDTEDVQPNDTSIRVTVRNAQAVFAVEFLQADGSPSDTSNIPPDQRERFLSPPGDPTEPEEPTTPEEPTEQPTEEPTSPEEGEEGRDPADIPACNRNQEIDVDIPLSWANNVPGVSGINDVGFTVPTLAGIECTIKQAIPTIPQVRSTVREVLQEELDGIPAPVVEVDEGLFGDTIDNLGEIVENTIEENIPELPDVEQALQDIQDRLDQVVEDVVDDLSEPIEDAQQAIEDVQQDIGELDLPDVDDPVEFLVDLLEDASDQLDGLNLLTNAEEFIDNQIDRVTDGLVSEDVLEELEQEVERVRERREDN
jgi:hypothetical protein